MGFSSTLVLAVLVVVAFLLLGFREVVGLKKNSILDSPSCMSARIGIAINQFRHQKCNLRNSSDYPSPSLTLSVCLARSLPDPSTAPSLLFVVTCICAHFLSPQFVCAAVKMCQVHLPSLVRLTHHWSDCRHPCDPLKHVTGGGPSSSISCRG